MYEHLYLKGSLRNSGEATGISALSVDGVGRSLAGVTIGMEGKTRAADELSWRSSIFVPYGATLTVYVPGPLTSGDHKITVAFDSPYGEVRIPFTDTVH